MFFSYDLKCHFVSKTRDHLQNEYGVRENYVNKNKKLHEEYFQVKHCISRYSVKDTNVVSNPRNIILEKAILKAFLKNSLLYLIYEFF